MVQRRILRRRDVEQLTGLGKPSLYRLIRAGAFPRPVKLGSRMSGWLSGEVEEWVEARRRERDA